MQFYYCSLNSFFKFRFLVGEGEGGMFRENSMYIIYSETDHQPRLDA